ncbi:MAG: hypothetical protein ACRELB_10390 [Polyangiaceae bacterium]
MNDAPRTGISVQFANAGIAKKFEGPMAKIFHALHLNGLVKAIYNLKTLQIQVDEHAEAQPVLGAHFIPCEPGEHKLDVAFGSKWGPGAVGMMSHAGATVVVEPGKITDVKYVFSGGPGNYHLEVVGTRDA